MGRWQEKSYEKIKIGGDFSGVFFVIETYDHVRLDCPICEAARCRYILPPPSQRVSNPF